MSDDTADKQRQVADLQCDLLEAHCDALTAALDNRYPFTVFPCDEIGDCYSIYYEGAEEEETEADFLVEVETFENARLALIAACRLARILKRHEKP